NPDASDYTYSTYIGGDANEGDAAGLCSDCAARYDGAAVAVDLFGHAYITGWTESTFNPDPNSSVSPTATPVNFPTKDAFQPKPGSSVGTRSRDAFVALFDTNTGVSSENSLVYSSFLGGSRQDE
ncbi:MAG: hypothetical protein DME70_08720, partial [Verrucomicrobia bacterium]